MKIKKSLIILLTCTNLCSPNLYAQTKPAKEKPPTQKEMKEMMKEMQQGMDEMSEEDKKEMEKMGVKMPDLNALQKTTQVVTDAQLKKGWEEDNRIVPVKDAKRIAAIVPTPTKTALPMYIARVHNAVSEYLSPQDKKDAEDVYQYGLTKSSTGMGNAAVGLWMGKYPLLAVYIMGKACTSIPADVNNINNYAAMLSMLGAEQLSIPVLQQLNAQYPGNSTILNNIGQAWFGLGDIDRSSKYLDSAIRIYAYHSQANLTKAKIEESKGNIPAAAEAVKRSIKTAYSMEKEDQLKKYKKPADHKDIDWPFPMPQDALGLHRFTWPAYPLDVQSSIKLKEEWNDFKEKCSNEVAALSAKRDQLEQQAEAENEARVKRLLAAGPNVDMNDVMPPYTPKAVLKLGYLVIDNDGSIAFKTQKLGNAILDALKKDDEFQTLESEAKEKIRVKYDPMIGEGKSNPLKAYCSEMNNASKSYLMSANGLLQEKQEAWLEFLRKQTNDRIYYAQYTMFPYDFELAKVEAKITWLNAISEQQVRFRDLGSFCEYTEPEKPPDRKLAEFDDVACKYHSSMKLVFMEINSSCSRLEGKLDIGPIKYTRKVDTDKDILIGATLIITVGAKKGWEHGPVAAEVKATVAGKVEWNEKQVTNWEFTAEAGVSAGSNVGVGDRDIEIVGAEASIGMNGSSVKGRGLLQQVNITNK